MIYELWETRSGNLAGAFDDEAAALRAVRDAVHRHGRGYVNSFALVRENSRGRAKTIAEGAALADLALSAGGGESGPSEARRLASDDRRVRRVQDPRAARHGRFFPDGCARPNPDRPG